MATIARHQTAARFSATSPEVPERGTLAQLVEQRTFNPLVAGSNPARPTKNSERARHPAGPFSFRLRRGRFRSRGCCCCCCCGCGGILRGAFVGFQAKRHDLRDPRAIDPGATRLSGDLEADRHHDPQGRCVVPGPAACHRMSSDRCASSAAGVQVLSGGLQRAYRRAWRRKGAGRARGRLGMACRSGGRFRRAGHLRRLRRRAE